MTMMMMNYDYDHDLMPYFMALIMRMIIIMIMAMIIATWTNWMTRLDLPTEREPMTATLRCFKGIFALCRLLVHLQIVKKMDYHRYLSSLVFSLFLSFSAQNTQDH